MVDFNSPTYPYERVQDYNRLRGAEEIPYKVLSYLLDLPDRHGYEPIDDNERARVRFIKYLTYDDENPLAKELPTPEIKRSILFDADSPVVNTDEEKALHPYGYRLFPQQFWAQTELEEKTSVKCYIGRVIPYSPHRTSIGITFEIMSGVDVNANTRTNAYTRIYNIEQCIIEALHGVNITGVGVVDFNKASHGDNGSQPYADEGHHVYRALNMSIDWMDSEGRAE